MNYFLSSNQEFLHRNKLSLFCATIVIVLFSGFLILRTGFEEKFYRELILTAGISFCFLFTPLLISIVAKQRKFFTCEISILTILISTAPFFRFIPASYFVLVVVGFASFVICLCIFLANAKLTFKLIITIVAGVGLIIWIAFTVWSVARPTLYESLAVNRKVFQAQDLFFHSAIAQMIKNYGVPSTGLQGTPYIFYHSGSHWYFAQMSHLLNMPVVRVYTIFYPLVIIPLFFKTFLTFVLALQRELLGRVEFSSMSFAFLSCIFLGIPPHLYSQGVVHTSVLILESQVLSMVFMFALLTMWLSFISRSRVIYLSQNRAKISLLIITSLLLWWIGYMKISTLFVLLGLFFFLVLRLRLLKSVIALSFVVTSLGSLVIYYFTVATLPFGLRSMGIEGDVSFGSFYKVMSDAGLFNPFDWFILFLLWTYIVLGIYLFTKFYPNAAPPALRSHTFSIVGQSAVIIAFIGLLPSFLFSFNNANAVFFVTIQMFVSGAILIAIGPELERYVRQRMALFPAYISCILIIAVMAYFRIRSNVKEILLENLNTRILISNNGEAPRKRFSLNADLPKLLWGYPDVDRGILKQPLYQTLKKLEILDTGRDHSNILVLISDYSNGNILKGTESLNCLEKSFMVPAITGYALVNGALYNCSIESYGEHYYKYPGKETKVSPEIACRSFGQRFDSIVVFNVERDSISSYQCKP